MTDIRHPVPTTITLSNGGRPTAHREGCAHLGQIHRRHDYEGEYTIDASSVLDIAVSYWGDFVDGGWDGATEPGSAETVQRALDYALSGEPKLGPCLHLPTGDVEVWVAEHAGEFVRDTWLGDS